MTPYDAHVDFHGCGCTGIIMTDFYEPWLGEPCKVATHVHVQTFPRGTMHCPEAVRLYALLPEDERARRGALIVES